MALAPSRLNTTSRRLAVLLATHVALLGLLVSGQSCAGVSDAQPSPSGTQKPTIVLVHGAFADGSSWQEVIPILQRDGYGVIAVQNPLSSFAADVETTKRVIVAEKGPVVVVGHSYGGAVITEAAAGSSNVKSLVYISAFAPEVNEAIGAFGEKYPAPLGAHLKPDAAGFLYVDSASFHDLFAADIPETETRIAAATQKPIVASAFGATVSQAAWKNVPSWYLVTQDDQALNPDLQRFYARRMNATTVEMKSSHVSFLSHPKEVARLIEQAASAGGKP